MFQGNIYTGRICPMGSEKIYDVIKGNCVKITPTGPLAKKSVDKVDEVMQSLILIENNIKAKEEEEDNELAEDLLDKDLEDFMKDSLAKFPNFIKRLEAYKRPRAGKAIEIFENFVESATKLMSIDVND